MPERIALEARGVSKRYGERDALCDVDLVAQPGRLHGLLGPNGAGKTTFSRAGTSRSLPASTAFHDPRAARRSTRPSNRSVYEHTRTSR